MKTPIDECPYCGHKYSFYTKESYHGTTKYEYAFDGNESKVDNSDQYNKLKCTVSKYVYCSKCNKRIFKTSEITSE